MITPTTWVVEDIIILRSEGSSKECEDNIGSRTTLTGDKIEEERATSGERYG